jgi:UDP-glucuronate decarboxylase
MSYSGQRVLVAGGAGFIGAHLVRALLGDGAEEVTVVDNYRTASADSLTPAPQLKVLQHDIIVPLQLDGPLDVIFNLACPASPVHYQADPIATWRSSVYGTDNLLTLARSKGARLVQASTSEVYGDPLESPQAETYRGNTSFLGPRACYDEGKRAAESLLMDFHRVHGTDVRIARLFNTYGPGMAEQDGRVVSNFIVQALRGEALTVYGNGRQTRSFCYVSDTVRGLMALGLREGLSGEVVNLGNPNEVTILALAEELSRLIGVATSHTHCPLPPDDPQRRCPDINRASRLLDWGPEVALSDGLAATIADFRTRLDRPGKTLTGAESP